VKVKLMKIFSKRTRQILSLVMLGFAGTVFTGIGSNAVYELFKGEKNESLLIIGIVSIFLGAILAWALAYRASVLSFSGSQARRWTTDKTSLSDRQALILMPSFVLGDATIMVDRAIDFVRAKAVTGDHAIGLIVDAEAADEFNRWPWQHTLRLLRAHPKLRIVVAVMSTQSAKSEQFTQFKRLVAEFRPNVDVVAVHETADILEYNSIEEALASAAQLCLSKGIAARKTCIDITGGPKSFSAVAAIKTLNSPFMFSYVVTRIDTEDPAEFGKVYMYDASVWNIGS
jgi:hypothetical protein